MNRKTLCVLVGLVVLTMAAMGDSVVRAQEGGCPTPGLACGLTSCGDTSQANCASEVGFFTPTSDTWTYVFDANNAIKIATTVPDSCAGGFDLRVERVRISQFGYITRRFSQFANTVCNPSSVLQGPEGTDCVFFRVHGNSASAACYDQVDYKIFWNTPYIQGNKHDWMLLRAPCEDPHGVTASCNDTQLFDEDITTLVDRKPPVGTDPVVNGGADGFSDYIVAITNDHPHKGIPATTP